MKKIGIIINPYSKKIMKMNDPVGYYKSVCGNIADIRLTKNIGDIEKAAEDFKKNGIPYVAISGGDGSIHNVISILYKIYGNTELPYILILKDGSMNNISKSYKLKGHGRVLLKKLRSAIENNDNIEIVYRNTIAIDDMCCFLFGLGFTANYINEFNKGGKKNPLKAYKIMLKTMLTAIRKDESSITNMMSLKLEVDGNELPITNYFAVYASTIKNLALGFKPTPRAYEKEKTFHLIASGLSPMQILLSTNKIRKGKKIEHPEHFDDIVSELVISYPGEFLYQMDGDIYTAKDKLFVTTGPRIGFVSI